MKKLIDEQKILLGAYLAKINKQNISDIHETEYQVFSQWGDDGIIQYLINQVLIENDFFIEFGVQNYTESNTRFLMMNNNWSGLVMDSSEKYINYIKKDDVYWKYDLTAKEEFITAENINELLADTFIPKTPGLLHIDIDGNDYWIWKAIKKVLADIVIVEYNSVFGIERPITIPYQTDFDRTRAHYSNLYFGTSLLSLCDLAEEKGYYFVGSNSAGNNAYFVKKEKIGQVKILSPEEGYVESKFRESRDESGKLTFKRGKERLEVIRGLPIYNTRTNQIEEL